MITSEVESEKGNRGRRKKWRENIKKQQNISQKGKFRRFKISKKT